MDLRRTEGERGREKARGDRGSEEGRNVMNCKKCGKELNPEDLFCSKCGTPVEKQEEPEQDIEETITEETVTEEEIEESVEPQEENTKPKVEKKFDINKFRWDLEIGRAHV